MKNSRFIVKILITIIFFSALAQSEDPEDSQPEATTEPPAGSEPPSETDDTTPESTSLADEPSSPPAQSTKKPAAQHDKGNPQGPKQRSPAQDSKSCSPWPSNLRPLRECCNLPSNPLSVTLSQCFYRCTARDFDEKRQTECGASCFVNTTGIYSQNRFNKDRIKTLMISTAVLPMKWIRVIENGIDSCQFSDANSLHDRLARFFGCLGDFMAENCVGFIQSIDCEKTQEHFEQCRKVKPLCDHWPFGYGTVENCCLIPTLFSQELRTKCHRECSYTELFLQRQAKCDEKCRCHDTKLWTEKRFDFDVVKGMLMQSSQNDAKWKEPIERAVRICRERFGPSVTRRDRHNTMDYEITALQACLREVLADDCVEFREESICRKVKQFMRNCPEIRPRKAQVPQQSI